MTTDNQVKMVISSGGILLSLVFTGMYVHRAGCCLLEGDVDRAVLNMTIGLLPVASGITHLNRFADAYFAEQKPANNPHGADVGTPATPQVPTR